MKGDDFMITITYNDKVYSKRKVRTIKTICECAFSILALAGLVSLIALDMVGFFFAYIVVALLPAAGVIKCLRILKHGQYDVSWRQIVTN